MISVYWKGFWFANELKNRLIPDNYVILSAYSTEVKAQLKISSLCTLFFLVVNPGEILCQPSNGDTLHAQLLYSQAMRFQNNTQFDSAIALYDDAALIYAKFDKIGREVLCAIKKAECYHGKGNYEKAVTALRIGQVKEDRLLAEDSIIAIQRLVVLGAATRSQAKYDTTLFIAYRALHLLNRMPRWNSEMTWNIYNLFAGTYFGLGDHDSAMFYNQKALGLFPLPDGDENLKVSSTYNSMASINESRGEYRKALDNFLRSLELRKLLLGTDHLDIANLYNNIAAIHMRLGELELSLEYYFKSLTIMQGILSADNPSFGIRYNNIAMVYRSQDDFNAALEYGEKSKTIFMKTLGYYHPNVGGVVNNIGRTYSDMKNYDRALNEYKEALKIWEPKLGSKHPNVQQCYFNIGEAYGNLGDHINANIWLRKALDHRLESLGQKNVKVGQSWIGLGRLYSSMNILDSSLLFYQNAIIALSEHFNETNIYRNPDSIRSSSDLDLISAFNGKSAVLRQRFQLTNEAKDLETSLSSYEKSCDVVEQIRRGFSVEGSKLLLNKFAFKVYEKGVSAALDLYAHSSDQRYLERAFILMERSKSGVLLDAINETNARQFSGIPDSLLEQESDIRNAIVFNETLIQKEREKKEKASLSSIDRWKNLIFHFRQKYDNLIKGFEENYPEYYSLKHQHASFSIKTLQENLSDDTSALVEYMIGDSTIISFVITQNMISARKVPIPSFFHSAVSNYRLAIQNLDGGNFIRHSYDLYKTLLHPIRKDLIGIRKIYIIPDGMLHYLPFETLLTKKQRTNTVIDYSALPYLIRDFEFSYHLSSRLFVDRNRNNTTTTGGFFGIAPVFLEKPQHAAPIFSSSLRKSSMIVNKNFSATRSMTVNQNIFPALPESENEVKTIYALFNEKRIPSKLFLHERATESVLSLLEHSPYRFLHIASHGIINEKTPKLSGILFAKSSNEPMGDGILYSGEIYNLKLNADLVVLSACETGLGSVARGEGIIGFTRAFVYAGAENVLVSLWPVSDRSSAEMMVTFYRNVLSGKSYAASLRMAKLTAIKSKKYSHPVEWSPYILSGK